MNVTEVMKELEALGTAQNRKVYARHGVKEPLFGVSYANQGKLRKRIKTDQALADALWATGNHDARILATMVADPAAIDGRTVDAWARDLDNYVLTDAFSGLVAKTPHLQSRMEKWTGANVEWIASAGWNLVGIAAGSDALADAAFERYLGSIEARIHSARNRVRHAMNQALIGIGTRPALTKAAVAAAARIGKVEVDHGETGCQTPDAAGYIKKTLAHRRQLAARRKAKTKKKAAKKPAKKTGRRRAGS